MSLARCKKCGKPRGTKRTYVASVMPVGYPSTAAVCGRAGCDEPALVWLEDDDVKNYRLGQRVFDFPNAAMKVRVS